MFYVEHRFSSKIADYYKYRIICVCIVAIFTFCGCEKPNANPETMDPIYTDLQKESDSATKDADKIKTEAEKLADDLSKLETRDPSRSILVNQKNGKYKAEAGMRQRAEYFHIRAEQRLKVDQREYLKAFEAKKPWPDPAEKKNYEIMRKLQTASREWGDRVPKNTRNDKGGPKSVKPEEKKAAAASSGEKAE